MVRKIVAVAFCVVILFAIGEGSHANAYSIYEDGNISSTYVTYFRDIVAGIGFNENYVAFRAGQYEYVMVVGQLEYSGGSFTLVGDSATVYTFSQETTGYNSRYRYDVTSIDTFSLDTNNRVIYSDLGDYPQLVSRGEKYEMLNTLLIIILLLSFVVFNMFRSR